jgi:hypothetical protein
MRGVFVYKREGGEFSASALTLQPQETKHLLTPLL